MSLLRELLGQVKPRLSGTRRVVANVGANEPEVRRAKRKASMSRRNRRAHLARKQDPTRHAAWKEKQAKWARDNADSMRSYRAAYAMRNEEAERVRKRLHWRRHYTHKGQRRGEAAAHSKLTDMLVRSARERYAAGGTTIKALAAEARVGYRAMWNAVNRKTWAHVE